LDDGIQEKLWRDESSDNKMGQKGTNAMFVMSPSDIPLIPKDRIITYARVVVNHRPQKEDPNCIRITVEGNLIHYPGKLTTRTADITTAKLHWNSMLSTPNAKFMCLDIKMFNSLPPLTGSNTCGVHLHYSCHGS
jgi:hypothetical protein